MTKSVELFYDGDQRFPTGALTVQRTVDGGSVSMQFSPAEDVTFTRRLEVKFTQSILDWTSATFYAEEQVDLVRDGNTLNIGDVQVPATGRIIPSYAATFLVEEFAAGHDAELNFTWCEEESRSVRSGRLRRDKADRVTSPVQQLMPPFGKVALLLDGKVQNTYWTSESGVVVSDWNGATSYALPSSVVKALYL